MDKVNILDVNIDNLTMEETITFIANSIKNGGKIHQVAVNAFIFVLLTKNAKIKESIVKGDLINGDGQSVVWASKILGNPLKERVTGIDLMEELVKYSFYNNYKIYLFGATQEIVESVVKIYSKKYSEDIIGGYRNGYYSQDEEERIVKEIAESGAHFLFVAMGSPKKELFLYKYRDVLNMPYIMAVGGSFDVIAGKVKRAPSWMQRIGLEWFYRVMQEPRRLWKRYLTTNTTFFFLVLKERLRMLKKICRFTRTKGD
jgi:N-acetylglucosaminyldiphosphoundecaprenol N-acetyl-beta-D-mannosaminyltransferase